MSLSISSIWPNRHTIGPHRVSESTPRSTPANPPASLGAGDVTPQATHTYAGRTAHAITHLMPVCSRLTAVSRVCCIACASASLSRAHWGVGYHRCYPPRSAALEETRPEPQGRTSYRTTGTGTGIGTGTGTGTDRPVPPVPGPVPVRTGAGTGTGAGTATAVLRPDVW